MERFQQILKDVLEDNVRDYVAIPFSKYNEQFILELEEKGVVTDLVYKMTSLVAKFNHHKLKEFLEL
jgi:hypothetical protein